MMSWYPHDENGLIYKTLYILPLLELEELVELPDDEDRGDDQDNQGAAGYKNKIQ